MQKSQRQARKEGEAAMFEAPPPQKKPARATMIKKNLKYLGAPLVLLQLVALLVAKFKLEPVFGFIEYYAGEAAVTKEQWARGVVAVPYDIRHSEKEGP